MHEFLHILLHSLIDTAKLLPILFIVYFLIEFLEYKNVFRFKKSKLLTGKASPVIGSLVGSVPQCGFSVVSAELYSERKISVGALIAVFIATSDEALPIMISNYKSIPALLCLILTKILFGVIVGYITMLLYSKIFKETKHKHHIEEHSEEKHSEEEHKKDDDHIEEHLHACCHHNLKENKFNWKHPLIHCIKIFVYIYIINVIFGTIIMFIGEDKLMVFLNSSKIFQPLLSIAIGLIPNCASSVIITELYLMGGLSFGSIIAGLSVNAGLGLIVLLKENKNKKENLFIILSLIISSLIIGYGLHFIPINLI